MALARTFTLALLTSVASAARVKVRQVQQVKQGQDAKRSCPASKRKNDITARGFCKGDVDEEYVLDAHLGMFPADLSCIQPFCAAGIQRCCDARDKLVAAFLTAPKQSPERTSKIDLLKAEFLPALGFGTWEEYAASKAVDEGPKDWVKADNEKRDEPVHTQLEEGQCWCKERATPGASVGPRPRAALLGPLNAEGGNAPCGDDLACDACWAEDSGNNPVGCGSTPTAPNSVRSFSKPNWLQEPGTPCLCGGLNMQRELLWRTKNRACGPRSDCTVCCGS